MRHSKVNVPSAGKLRVVIDTNVMISSFWGGKPFDIIQMWNEGRFILLTSRQILNEYIEVLKRFNLPEEDIDAITILLSDPRKTFIVNRKSKVNLVKQDPEDNKFLECALDGNADYIISGDIHLLECYAFKYCKIITPAEFLERI
jgi:uncharacterized protein